MNCGCRGNGGLRRTLPSPSAATCTSRCKRDVRLGLLRGNRAAAAVRRRGACKCKRDPLEAEIWNSWQDNYDDWGSEKFTEEELIDILFDEDGSAETAAQNILAIALVLVLSLAAGSILWRLALVSWALVAAGVRYSIVAVLLLLLAMVFF